MKNLSFTLKKIVWNKLRESHVIDVNGSVNEYMNINIYIYIYIQYLCSYIYMFIYIYSMGGGGFPGSSDPDLIPGLGRSPGDGISYPLQYSWASLVAQMIKHLSEMQET